MTGPTIIGAQRFRDDDGSADPRVRQTLDAHARGTAGDRQVLSALGSSRLLVPVVTMPADGGADDPDEVGGEPAHRDHDTGTEVALPLMLGEDGRRGVLAFTGVDTMRSWRSDARPVPISTADACRAALDENVDALVVDVAGPVSYAVEGHFLATLAEHGEIPEPKEDPQVLATIYRITHTEFGIERVRIHESTRADIGVRLELDRRDNESMRRVADRMTTELAQLLPGGVELSAVVRAKRGE
ncbi:SseB family protein [Halostreptopolyspora alba]|uniref:SseB family protein n=1 Tax=Halostreptopolyspora alba TaxID=2487137 RepID=A0A3N0EEZ0_9ACTN|nr:SseB family protein [Nocardiopsaceae bacterium YIM 96095]